jgi:hypothetical protein
MDDLLALRAGEGSVWARRHSATCAACQAELEAVYQRVAQLKALPALRPARDRWPAVRTALRTERSRRRRVMAGWSSLAAAAALTSLFVLLPTQTTEPTDTAAGPQVASLAQLDSIKQRSASLEDRLLQDPLRGRVMSGWEAAMAAELEDRIALIDGQLGAVAAVPGPVTQVDLWRQRVDLMERLYTVRRATYQGM